MVGNPALPTENINEVILGLLKIKSGTELDYQTYFKIILNKLAIDGGIVSGVKKLPTEESQLLREEFKRVKKLKGKGRFKVKKKKSKIIPSRAPKTGAIIKAPFAGITKDFIKPPVEPVSDKEVTDKTPKINKDTNILQSINKTLESILNTLTNIKNQDIKESEKRRRSEEEKKITGKESSLESKTFDGLKKAISTVIKPFQSIWDKIVNFITNVILGRIVLKLIDWFVDPKNQGKIQSLIRFVKDWWPALLGSYILFGTQFGGLIRFVGGWAVRLAFQIGKTVIPQLLSLIAKNPFAALAVAGGVGAYVATQQNKKNRDEFAKTDPSIVKPEETAKTGKGPGPAQLSQEQIGQQGLGLAFSGGGAVRYPRFAGGGFNFNGMMGGAGMGAMFGPLGMLLGGALGSGKPQEMFNGFVKGPGGPKDDKVPAMLSDGEFVMSAGAVQKYGVDTLESMNAAGGGDNKPKIMGGTTYAAGGGFIGSERYDLTAGFRGESSKSDVYLVRAINELVKVLNKRFGVGNQPNNTSQQNNNNPQNNNNLIKQLQAASGSIGQEINQRSSQTYNNISNDHRINSIGKGLQSAGSSVKKRASQVYDAITNDKRIQQAQTQTKKITEKAQPMLKSLPSTIDYGSLYLKSQLGGLGGSITEADLSQQTQDEYKKAYERAKADAPNRRARAESVVRQYEGLLKGPNITKEQKADFNNKLSAARSEVAKYKKGLVNVEYSDFNDEKGKLSPAAKAAQKTLGAVWASSTKDGGIKVEKEPYDFPLIKDPIGLMRWKQLSKKEKEEWLNKQDRNNSIRKKLDPSMGGSYGKWGQQDIAEAMYTLNPFATPVETDVKLGGKPRAKGIVDKVTNFLDNPLLSMGRGSIMNLLKGKERNVITGEAEKDSLWDKMFPSEKKKKEEFLKNNPAAKLYDKPKPNTRQPYKLKFERPKNAGVLPAKPPVKPQPRPQPAGGGMGGRRGGGANPSRAGTKPPSLSPTHPSGMRSNLATLGIMR